MKVGDTVRCIDAKEPSIPIKEGLTYTIKKYFKAPHGLGNLGDGEIEDLRTIDGVELVELPDNYFMVTRFEVCYDHRIT